MPSESADAGVEEVPPHSAELVEQVAAGDVVWIPKTLRLQALRTATRQMELFQVKYCSSLDIERVDIQMHSECVDHFSKAEALKRSNQLHKTALL